MYVGNQLARIHIGRKALGLDEDTYRALLLRLTGKSSSKEMSVAERLRVLSEMQRLGAFQKPKRLLTPQQKACLAKWYKLRRLGAVKSTDKSSFNAYIRKRFSKNNLADLSDGETNKLFNMLEAWIQEVS